MKILDYTFLFSQLVISIEALLLKTQSDVVPGSLRAVPFSLVCVCICFMETKQECTKIFIKTQVEIIKKDNNEFLKME